MIHHFFCYIPLSVKPRHGTFVYENEGYIKSVLFLWIFSLALHFLPTYRNYIVKTDIIKLNESADVHIVFIHY
jgi:hypothetical protein